MADITQRFSIDVTGAIQALNQLDQKMKNFGSTVDGLANRLKSFNAAAQKALNLDGKNAEAAANRAKKAFDALFTTTSKAGSNQGQLSSGLNKTASALNNVGRSASNAQGPLSRIGTLGQTAFRGLFGSLSQLGRILGTRLLIQGFGALQQAITGSISSASDLQRSIREVATILPPAQRNADALTQAVRRLSDTFNLPIDAVTEGLYQTISNQIGDAATSIGFLETAAKFSKAAVTDIDTSVNLLSGTLNAFGGAATDADAIAGKLFTTIELGRTRASELAQSLGRVLPVASELGVSLDEVLAGFATVTIAGIKTSEATTQLRGAFNALLKPTEATKELLAELGFTSGEALIQARGLQGAFAALQEAAGGSITELSKFIPRVRGLNAALILAGSGAEKFEENLQRIRESAGEVLNERFELVIDSDAERVARQVNELKNLFTVDLGQALLEALAAATEFVGGLDTVGAALKTIAPIAVVAVGGIAALAAGMFAYNTVATAATGISTALGVSLTALGAIAAVALAPIAAFAALQFAETSRIAAIEREIEAIKERNRQELAFEQKQNAARRQLRDADLREFNAKIQEEIAAFNKGFSERVKIAKEANDEIIKDQERVVKAVLNAAERIVNETQRRIDSENKIQETARDNARSAAQELSDFEFNARNKNFNQLQQFSNLQQRANQQRREAADLVRRAAGANATEDDIERARAAIERAQATAEEASSIADSTGNRAAQAQIEGTLRDILRQKLQAENAITRASEQRERIERERLARQQKELDNLKKLAQDVLNAPGLFDDQGQPLTGDAQAEALKERERALAAFRQAVAGSESLTLEQIIDTSTFARSFENQINAADIRNLSVNNQAFTQLRNDINQNLADFRAEFGAVITSLELREGVQITNPGELSTALTDQLQFDQSALQADDSISESIKAVELEVNTLKTALDQIPEASNNVFSALGIAFRAGLEGVGLAEQRVGDFARGIGGINQVLFPIAEQFRQTGTLTDDQIKKIEQLQLKFTELGGVDAAPLGTGEAATITNQLLSTLTQIATKQAEIRQLQQQAAQQGGLQQQLQNNQQIFDAVKQRAQAIDQETQRQKEAASASGDTAQNTGQAATNINQAGTATNSQVASSAAVAQNWQIAASASAQVASNASQAGGGGAATARIGRFFPRFLNAGGFAPRGTDTIPAMLSPGEFVVNARSTKRFFSQLQSINAGRQPIYRQDGGPVTNVGDINVTVGADKEAASTGRQIARSIRRELRRGTSSL